MPQTLKCPSCAAPLEYDGRNPTIQCSYCNNIVLMPETSRSSSPAGSGFSFLAGHSSTVPPDLATELNDLIRRGLKIAAIKRYRESYNVGLKEAKDAVDALERGERVNAPGPIQMPSLDLGAAGLQLNRLVEINDLIERGNKIGAIKLFRETYNVGLKEAKDAVEALERGEMISLAGGQTISAFHMDTAGIMDAGRSGHVVSGAAMGRPLSANPAAAQKSGCLGPFLGQWGCLMFGFFWVAFIMVMVGTLIFPSTVLATAPVLCPDGYLSASAERVSYYSTSNFEGNNIVLLHCQVGDGPEVTPHPMLVSSLLCGGYLAIFALLSFFILIVRRIPAILKM